MYSSNDILRSYLKLNRKITEEMRGHFGTMNLTFPQTLVLTLIETEGPMTISALAKAIGSANSTVSGILDRLEKLDLIRRVRSSEDRRVNYVEMTDKYRDIISGSSTNALAKFSNSLQALSEEDTKNIIDSLELLYAVLESNDRYRGCYVSLRAL